MYKQRHFHRLDSEKITQGKQDYRAQLLRTANARIIGPYRFNELVDKAEAMAWKLDHKFVNLPRSLEESMHTRLLAAYAKQEDESKQKSFFPKVRVDVAAGAGEIPPALLKDLPADYLASLQKAQKVEEPTAIPIRKIRERIYSEKA